MAKAEWEQIGFKEFVDLQQALVINKTGSLEKSGYYIEWSKITKMGFSHPYSTLRLEERPHVRIPMNEMSAYFKRKGKK